MEPIFGIGVITYKRFELLKECIKGIEANTVGDYKLVIADDDYADKDVQKFCEEKNIIRITGANTGVCWNKNRALYTLHKYLNCDPILLLEDDCAPCEWNWDKAWKEAATIWHRVGYASPTWIPRSVRGGNGTPEAPWVSNRIAGQADITSRYALEKVGYLDTRFVGYGFGHIEWTNRFAKAKIIKFGHVPCMNIGLKLLPSQSFGNPTDVRNNQKLFTKLRSESRKSLYKLPWCSAEEKNRLETEVKRALRKTGYDI